MDLRKWFRHQLQASGDGLTWAIQQVAEERRYARPPGPLGEWSAARHLFHMTYNETYIVVPRLEQWIGDPSPPQIQLNERSAWEENHNLEDIVADFQAIRAKQIDLLTRFEEAQWDEPRDTAIGPVTLRWVLTKSYQHTLEHVNDILRIALFWDRLIDGG